MLKEESFMKKQWQTQHWQESCLSIIKQAKYNLLKSKKPLEYLIDERGLNFETIKKYNIGWFPENKQHPAKHIIPVYNSQGKLLRLKFRNWNKTEASARYKCIDGSCTTHPYPIGIQPGKAVIIVESELDAILIHQETHNIIGVLGLGNDNVKLTPEMKEFLNKKIPVVLISLDNDRNGWNLTKRFLSEIEMSSKWWPAPCGKDPGDAWKKVDLKSWVKIGMKT